MRKSSTYIDINYSNIMCDSAFLAIVDWKLTNFVRVFFSCLFAFFTLLTTNMFFFFLIFVLFLFLVGVPGNRLVTAINEDTIIRMRIHFNAHKNCFMFRNSKRCTIHCYFTAAYSVFYSTNAVSLLYGSKGKCIQLQKWLFI